MMKRIFDILCWLPLLCIFAPFMIVAAIAIRLESKGPILFVQERIGRNGVNFRMFKFRSMVDNAESFGTGLFSYADDPRVTRVGAFIRRTSIDEMPQIFNVLFGSMSIVGPRPIVTYEHGKYEDFGPDLRKRFNVKPGITGLAQITGRNKLTWEEKVAADIEYVDRLEKYGVLEDIRILLRTAVLVLSMRDTIEERSEND